MPKKKTKKKGHWDLAKIPTEIHGNFWLWHRTEIEIEKGVKKH